VSRVLCPVLHCTKSENRSSLLYILYSKLLSSGTVSVIPVQNLEEKSCSSLSASSGDIVVLWRSDDAKNRDSRLTYSSADWRSVASTSCQLAPLESIGPTSEDSFTLISDSDVSSPALLSLTSSLSLAAAAVVSMSWSCSAAKFPVPVLQPFSPASQIQKDRYSTPAF